MKTSVTWKDEMEFDGATLSHTIHMDAKPPIGKDTGATPKELVAIGLGGCTAMDVIALLKKYKQIPQRFSVDVEVQNSTGSHPVVFEKATLTFNIDGNVVPEKVIEAIRLSQTKYCGVSAMLSQALPIDYRIILNGQEVGSGEAKFEVDPKASP